MKCSVAEKFELNGHAGCDPSFEAFAGVRYSEKGQTMARHYSCWAARPLVLLLPRLSCGPELSMSYPANVFRHWQRMCLTDSLRPGATGATV